MRPPPRSTLFPYTTLSDLPAFRGTEQSQGQDPPDDEEEDNRILGVQEEIGQMIPEGIHAPEQVEDRKSTRLNSSHLGISYAVFCLKKKSKLQSAAKPTN